MHPTPAKTPLSDQDVAEQRAYLRGAEDERRVATALREHVALADFLKNADLVELLHELEEFLDDQADADGDCNGFTPNTAMRLQVAVQRAIAFLPAKQEA